MRRFFIRHQLTAIGQRVTLSEQDSYHIRHVLRLRSDTNIEIVDTTGQVAAACIEHISDGAVSACIVSLTAGGAEPPVSLVLAQGLPKADKMDYIVQKAVELGAAMIQPLRLERSIVRYDCTKAAARQKRWQQIAYEAAKQSRRECLPTVAAICELEEFLQEYCKRMPVFMLYEGGASLGLGQAVYQHQAESCCLLIGPEGGFSQDELALCQQYGAIVVSLGPRILRTETASLAALSIIFYQYGALGGLPCE